MPADGSVAQPDEEVCLQGARSAPSKLVYQCAILIAILFAG